MSKLPYHALVASHPDFCPDVGVGYLRRGLQLNLIRCDEHPVVVGTLKVCVTTDLQVRGGGGRERREA